MDEKIIIFGIGQFAELVYNFVIKENKYIVGGFCIDSSYINENKFLNLPVVPFEKVENYFSPEDYKMIICIGYTKMNSIREEKTIQAQKKGYKIIGYRHPTAIILSDNIDETNIIMEGVIIGQKCVIGKSNVFWPMSHVAHHTEIGNYNFLTISCSIAGNIHIGNRCIFGNNCTVKDGVTIGDSVLIGAGAYISHNLENDSVYVPPRTYKLKDKKSTDFF